MSDFNDLAQSLYPNSQHSDSPALTPQKPSEDAFAKAAQSLYPNSQHSDSPAVQPQKPYEDVFKKDARERREATAAQERQQSDARRGEIKSAVADALKEQKPAQPQQQQQRQAQPQPKTPEQLQADAAQLATDLKLDANHPDAQPFASLASELGIGKDGAAKLIEFDQRRSAAAWSKRSDEWAAASSREFTQAHIADAKLVTRFADAEGMAILGGPYGNHPALVRMLAKAGAALRKAGAQ